MNREVWWGTPIWFYDISPEDINTDILEQECYEIMKKEKGVVKSNINGWQSNSIDSPRKDAPTINKLIRLFIDKAKIVYEDYGVKPIYKCSFENAWININQKGASNTTHIHNQAILSGVFYIKCNKDSGDFYLDKNYTDMYMNDIYLKNNNYFTYNRVTYEPIKNRIILFPSWVPHGVEINKSNEDRISIAFNIGRLL